MLSGLPEAIDVLALRALLNNSNSSIASDLAALPEGACVHDALRVLLECPAFYERITHSDMWNRFRSEHTVLGALIRRSPMMEDLPYWEDVGAAIQVGDPLEQAIERATLEMKTLQRAWGESQARSTSLFLSLLNSSSTARFNHTCTAEWFREALHAGRERTTEAARMQLLGSTMMADHVAFNILDLCLRMCEHQLGPLLEEEAHDEEQRGARRGGAACFRSAVDWSYSFSPQARIAFDGCVCERWRKQCLLARGVGHLIYEGCELAWVRSDLLYAWVWGLGFGVWSGGFRSGLLSWA